MARQGGCLAGDTFHQVAIAAERIDIEVEEIIARPVVSRAQPASGHRHAYARSHSLSERAGGDLHSRRPAILGVTWATAVPLSKIFYVVERDSLSINILVRWIGGFDPSQIDQAAEQHGSMAAAQHKTVAIDPFRVVRVVAQEPLAQGVSGWRRVYRCPRMA